MHVSARKFLKNLINIHYYCLIWVTIFPPLNSSRSRLEAKGYSCILANRGRASPINNCYPHKPAVTTELSASPGLTATVASIMCSSENATASLSSYEL